MYENGRIRDKYYDTIKKIRRILALVLIVVLLTPILDSLSINTAENASMENKSDVYLGNGFIVTYSVTNEWSGYYSGTISIENTGSSTIETWALDIKNCDKIENIWNEKIA